MLAILDRFRFPRVVSGVEGGVSLQGTVSYEIVLSGMRSGADLVNLIQRGVSQFGHDAEKEQERGVRVVLGRGSPRLSWAAIH